jgi:hypothetical protein
MFRDGKSKRETTKVFYTFEDLNPHAKGVLFISFKGNVADK